MDPPLTHTAVEMSGGGGYEFEVVAEVRTTKQTVTQHRKNCSPARMKNMR